MENLKWQGYAACFTRDRNDYSVHGSAESNVTGTLHLLLASPAMSPAHSLVPWAFFSRIREADSIGIEPHRPRTPRHADCPRKGDVIKIIIFQRSGLTSVSLVDYTAACNAISITLTSLFSWSSSLRPVCRVNSGKFVVQLTPWYFFIYL